jgi:crossover junction endodeoxyribonuclease RuvC
MKILGVDPGLKATGYGVIEANEGRIKLIEVGTINPNPRNKLPKKIDTVYQNLADIIKKFQPDVMILEKLYAHHRHPTTASILGHVRGVICLLCAQHHVTLEEHSVKRIRKAITGNGNASKIQTQRMVTQMLKIDDRNLTLDASDALALCLGHVHMAVRQL